MLKEAGMDFCYECMKFELIPALEYPSIQRVGKEFKLRKAERPTTYTPDFVGDT